MSVVEERWCVYLMQEGMCFTTVTVVSSKDRSPRVDGERRLERG